MSNGTDIRPPSEMSRPVDSVVAYGLKLTVDKIGGQGNFEAFGNQAITHR